MADRKFNYGAYKDRVAKRKSEWKIKVKKTREWKPGYRMLHKRLEDHRDGKAIRFEYFRWQVWLSAKGVLLMPDGTYICSHYLISQAKAHPSARLKELE